MIIIFIVYDFPILELKAFLLFRQKGGMWEICLCCCLSTANGVRLVSKGGVYTKLAGVDHRVFSRLRGS